MRPTCLRASALLAGVSLAFPALSLAQAVEDSKSDAPKTVTSKPKTSAKSRDKSGSKSKLAKSQTQDKSASTSADSTGSPSKSSQEVPSVSLIEAMNKGLVKVDAEGNGDGQMTVAITNKTKKPLNVVLPAGLIAQSATGQMGGMGGGMGGGGGGMGGGGMGGGGMGGGGMGGGMGGGGGGMGGGMRGGGVMPASQGMIMLARLIMNLIERDSWDMTSLTSSMGGMGGMGGGGMGGGGMGGGGMGGGGMGGGMRSVPPTSLPNATFKPNQTRELPVRLVSLSPPDAESETGLSMPAKGEKLQLGDISQTNNNENVQKALKRLAALKAPQSISQLVLWKLNSETDWETIAQLSKGWANTYELTLARDFVDHLDTLTNEESGTLMLEVSASKTPIGGEVDELKQVFKSKGLLGLKAVLGVPATPTGPSVGCKVQLGESQASVEVISTDGVARAWVPFGKFTLPIAREEGKMNVAKFADALSEEILNRLVRAQLSKGPRVNGKETYKLRVDNASPLILNGLGILGTTTKTDEPAKILPPLSLSPRRSVTMPASEAVVKHLELKKGTGGVRVVAADLSGL